MLNIVLHGTFYTTLELGKRWIRRRRRYDAEHRHLLRLHRLGLRRASAAAKAGVLAFTRSLAVEWARHGIRQVAIAPAPSLRKGPGATRSDAGAGGEALDRVPLGRVGEKDELAKLAAY